MCGAIRVARRNADDGDSLQHGSLHKQNEGDANVAPTS
jgi:hypothetical protein